MNDHFWTILSKIGTIISAFLYVFGVVTTIYFFLKDVFQRKWSKVRRDISLLLIATALFAVLFIGLSSIKGMQITPPSKSSGEVSPTATHYSPTITVGLGTPSPTPYPTTQSSGHPPTATPKPPTVTPTSTPKSLPTSTADPCPYNNGVYYQTVDGFNSPLLIAGDPAETASVENQIASRFTPCQNYGHQAAAIEVWSYVNSDTTTATKQGDAIISLMQNLSTTDEVFANTHYSVVTATDTKNYAELYVTWRR